MDSLVVFSHLRWDFVFQRPQHLMTRLARAYRVFFVEEPDFSDGPPRLEITEAAPNVFVCRPHTSISERGFHDDQLPALKQLLEDLVAEQNIQDPISWLYTPMALPLIPSIKPRAVVYDCMDELSAFLKAPRQLLQRERALLKTADVVFTGGPSLYRAKQGLHESVYCFPSSVEKQHFAQARDRSIEHSEQQMLARPRLGFYGVIDERLDLSLIAQLAAAHPEWQIIMVGPVVKIDPATLPQRSNIHYFGQRSYDELPRFLAGWDACLLPFALNAATRFISPTKTLEYLAAEKPIVSTAVRDVVELYGEVVHTATTPLGFITACEAVISESKLSREESRASMRAMVDQASWDSTAAQMLGILKKIAAPAEVPLQTNFIGTALPPVSYETVVIGAGPTGLSAAFHLGEESLLLEQNDSVGGWCRSIQDRGFTFDYAGHIMFSNDPYVHDLYRMLLGDNLHWQNREAWVYSKSVHTRYPFQGALYGLPPDVLKECIVGAIEARFGPLGETSAALTLGSGGSSPSACKADSITDCCADGTDSVLSTSSGTRARAPAAAPRNFEDFIYSVWGKGVAKHFAVPYNRKLWAVPLAEMETSWLGGRVPQPDLEEMIDGALRPSTKPVGPNARFGYPLHGGFQALVDGFLPNLQGHLKLKARVARVVPSEHLVVLSDGSAYTYEQLISTMPLPVLISLIGDEAPQAVIKAVRGLRHVSVRCVNLGIGREDVSDKHWIYYPEDTVFHRIFVQGNASPHVNPPGGFGLTCEITYAPGKPLPCDGDALIERCIADCIRVGMISETDAILASNQVDMPYAYVVYDHVRARNVDVIRQWLDLQDIVLAGRYSEWEYYNSDHAFIAGKKAAEYVRQRHTEKSGVAVPRRETGDRQNLPVSP
jgi:protoporphyrinogen oxidase/glycosyltransferase involved in cell wall biosynthesis